MRTPEWVKLSSATIRSTTEGGKRKRKYTENAGAETHEVIKTHLPDNSIRSMEPRSRTDIPLAEFIDSQRGQLLGPRTRRKLELDRHPPITTRTPPGHLGRNRFRVRTSAFKIERRCPSIGNRVARILLAMYVESISQRWHGRPCRNDSDSMYRRNKEQVDAL